MKSGIYKLYFENSKKVYVGSSVNINKRIYEHKRTLNNQKHHNIYLQRAYNKNLKNKISLCFEVLENCDCEKLIEREVFWMEKLKSNQPVFGYNIDSHPSKGTLGKKFSGERLKKQQILLEAAREKRKQHFKFISPDGEIVEIFGLRQFCIKNNLPYRSMCQVHYGNFVSSKGWTKFYEDGYKKPFKWGKEYLIKNPEGLVLKIKNLKQFCRDNSLWYESLRKGFKSKGFSLIEKIQKDDDLK